MSQIKPKSAEEQLRELSFSKQGDNFFYLVISEYWAIGSTITISNCEQSTQEKKYTFCKKDIPPGKYLAVSVRHPYNKELSLYELWLVDQAKLVYIVESTTMNQSAKFKIELIQD